MITLTTRFWGIAFSLLLAMLASSIFLFGQVAQRAEAGPTVPRQPQSNRIIAENSLQGTDDWANIGNYDKNALSSYAGASSVNAGAPITVYVSSTGSTLSARLYRLGYYQNHGARLVTTFTGISTPLQPACTRLSTTGLVRCPWAATFTINTGPSWISGIYLLRIDSNNGFRFFNYFVVRNDSYNAPFLFQEATMTNQAYNSWGDESLYYSGNNEGRVRAYQVSFDRPYNSGAGTGSFFVHDIDMVRWLEASGYDVAYISDVDAASNVSYLLNHRVFLEVGHPEYWTWEERDHVEAALSSGVNIVFASGNESFWNVRLEDTAVGANRIITCYKNNHIDPTPVAPHVTVSFNDPILNRPDNALVGLGYQSYYDDAIYNYPWVLAGSPDRLYFDCTGLQAGDAINNVVGEEWDALVDNGRAPAGLQVLAQSSLRNDAGRAYPANSAVYTAPGGAKVFSFGSIHWSWGLIDHSYPNQVFQSYALSNDADHRAEQMMANILDYFAGYWDGQSRPCGAPYQTFYDIGPRPTRTPRPQAPTPTGTPSTPTPTNSRTSTPVASATSTRTQTPAASYTPTLTPAPVLVGHVRWQGRPPQPGPLQQLPISITLTSGADRFEYSRHNTDAGGFFTISVALPPTGTYGWRVKGPQFLSNSGSLALTGAERLSFDAGQMPSGDANNDNLVNIADFNILKPNFGLAEGDPNYDPRADFTGDSVVNGADFNLLRSNLGVAGG